MKDLDEDISSIMQQYIQTNFEVQNDNPIGLFIGKLIVPSLREG